MRNLYKITYIGFVGLLVATFVYPLIHEAGHLIATVAFGGTVTRISVFPLAYTGCDVFGVGTFGKTVIGLSGILLPALLCCLRFRNFYIWYPVFILRGITFLSLAISLVAIVLFYGGVTLKNEDIIQVLQICGGYSAAVIGSVAVLSAFFVILIARDHPLKRFAEWLSEEERRIPEKKNSQFA